jgi:hypothetical protein
MEPPPEDQAITQDLEAFLSALPVNSTDEFLWLQDFDLAPSRTGDLVPDSFFCDSGYMTHNVLHNQDKEDPYSLGINNGLTINESYA